MWTPYRAFDEISRIREDLENSISPIEGFLPNSAPSSSRLLTPRSPTSITNGNGDVMLSTSSVDDAGRSDDDVVSPRSSPPSIVQGIKDEIARLANLPSPVRPLSPHSDASQHDVTR